MKVILTESQFKILQEIESANLILENALNEGEKIDHLKKMIKKLLYTGVAITSIIAAINKQDLPQHDKDELIRIATHNNEMDFLRRDSIETAERQIRERDSIKQEKIKACENYMKYALENQNYTFKSTGLKPETLVDVSINTGFDLPFLMAAAHQESCFGATSRAKRTNSVFSEGCYDNGQNVVTYNDPNDSVMGYVKLLRNDYLIDGKTLFDLLKPGQFVNYNGDRYASDTNYEKDIKNIRNRIIRMYPILAT